MSSSKTSQRRTQLDKFLSLADWFRDHYLPIILCGLLVGFIIGIRNTILGQTVKNISSYLTFLMMFCVSLTISPHHFVLILRNPRSVLIGIALNFMLLPALCYLVVSFLVRDPLFSAGVLLIGLVPSAINASVWTAMLDGETAVSMAINAASIVFSSLLIPPVMSAFLSSENSLSISSIMRQVLLILVTPLCLGLLLQAFWGKYLQPIRRILPVVSAMIGVIFAFGTCNLNTPTLIAQRHLLLPMLLAALLIFPCMFAFSYWITTRFLPHQAAVATTFAGSMKNLSVAMGIAFANFPPAVALPITIFSIPHMITSVLFYQYLKKRNSGSHTVHQHNLESIPVDHSSGKD
jgi:bile acid:Na+ symporter, BASS family